MLGNSFVDRRRLMALLKGAFSVGRLALLLSTIGLLIIAVGVYRMATPVETAALADSEAMKSLQDIEHSLLSDIARVVRPAIARMKKLAADPQVSATIQSGNRGQQTEICNGAIVNSTEIDSIALFDGQGKILAINSIYASGKAIDRDRVERILGLSFDHRDIIQECARNEADDLKLEFQTKCDITPAFFDSSGLSIACSVPVRDKVTGKKIGVASSRLRFDRLTDLTRSRLVGGKENAIDFITDQGGYFSEGINAGMVVQPIPQAKLAALVAPLVAGTTDSCFTSYEGNYLLFSRLKDFATLSDGGIQVMITADKDWVTMEANQARKLSSTGTIATGLLFCFLGAFVLGGAALRRSARLRATLAAIVRFSDDAIISETLDGRITSWNHAAERMYGYRAEEVLGKTISFLLSPKQIEAFQCIRAAVRQGRPFQHFDTEFIRKDGTSIAISVSVSPIKDNSGKVIGIAKITRDISDRKNVEFEHQQLASDRDRVLQQLQTQIHRMPLAYLLMDADFRIIEWNPAAERMLGFSREEALGMGPPFEKIVPESVAPMLPDLLQRFRDGDMTAHTEIENLTKGGRTIFGQWFNTPLIDDDGSFAGLLCLGRDITDHKRMEADLAARDEQLRQSHKLEAVGSLAGGIAHEFNNLLQVVLGYSKYAMEGLSPEDQRYQDLDQVIKAADRATALTRQLLGFSRRQTLERVTFDHREVLSDLVQLLRPLIGEQIDLKVSLEPNAEPIEADRGLLQQMLLNLCINARDAMPEGGVLMLKTQRVVLSPSYCENHPGATPGVYLAFSISDTGHGMTAEVKERIFEPFFTTKGVGKGTGLGLAMVYGCVQQHNGLINVYSEVGHGTTFRIHLPLVAGATSNSAQYDCGPAAVGGTETILIAEDEPMVRNLAVRILTKAGYSVIEASNGAEAVSQFEAHADIIALAVLDAVMPKMTGQQANARIKEIAPDLPVIFCSGYDPETNQVQSLLDHGCRLVQKPYDPDWLLLVVRDALDQRVRRV